MRNLTLLLLACCIGLSGGLSCTTRQASPSTSQTSDSQAAVAAAKAQKDQEAADAKAVKKAAAEAKAKQEQEEKMAAAAAKARKKQEAADAKALKKDQASTPPMMSTNTATPAPVPAVDPNAPLTKEQKLNDLNRRYKNDEITPLEYQTERAKIMAEP